MGNDIRFEEGRDEVQPESVVGAPQEPQVPLYGPVERAPCHHVGRPEQGAARPVRQAQHPGAHRDEVQIVRGTKKSQDRSAKVTAVYRRKFVIQIEKLEKERNSGQPVKLGIHPSNVVITKLKIDKDRQAILDRAGSGSASGKGKYQSNEV